MDICRPLYAPKADKAVEIGIRFGDSLLEQSLYVMHLFDWAAFYLAGLNGVPPGPPGRTRAPWPRNSPGVNGVTT
jgi:glucose/mannose-6-phosphate isomerase